MTNSVFITSDVEITSFGAGENTQAYHSTVAYLE
jgi:hypothetical protein